MKHIVSTLIFLLSVASVNAALYKVKGVLVDSIGDPEAYATIRIYAKADTIKPSVMGVTNEFGAFEKQLPEAGDYLLRINSVGKNDVTASFSVTTDNPNADLGTITTSASTNMLAEVSVTASRPLVTKEIDRIGYDVQADEESKTSTLEETLRKVPLVSVDADGTIKVKGSSDFKIYKNGRPNNSFTKNAKDIFKAIPASMIKKIEIITDPGAREDAEGVGAILNIVTLENTVMKGIMGSASLQYNTNGSIPSPNIWLSTQIDKVTLSAYAGVNHMSKRMTRSRSVSDGVYEDSGNKQHSESQSTNKGWITWWGLEGSYELDSLNLFTAEFGGYLYNVDVKSNSSYSRISPVGNMIYHYDERLRYNPYQYLDFNGNFNYQHSTRRKGETIILSYMISTTNQQQEVESSYYNDVNMPVDYQGINSDFKLNFIEHTFQADWTRPFGKIHVLDIGGKYIYRDNHSRTRQEYIGLVQEPLIDFSHITHVAAAYADYRIRLNRVNLRGGLRYEYSRLTAKYADDVQPSFAHNLSDWVPNASISYNINDANTIKFSFGTRINRPGINYLNPTVQEGPTSTSQGNPHLGSAHANSLSLNYNLISRKINIDITAGYNFTNNDIVQVVDVINDYTYSGYANAGRSKTFNAGLFMQWTASPKTSLMINGNTAYRHYANPSLNITNGGWSNNVYARVSQKLPWKISGNLGISLWTGTTNGLYGRLEAVRVGMFKYNISLQRSFLKDDRLTVKIMAQNPIYPARVRYKSTTANQSYAATTISYEDNCRMALIGVSYRFGSMNTQVKKTAKSIANDDLIGRKSGGE